MMALVKIFKNYLLIKSQKPRSSTFFHQFKKQYMRLRMIKIVIFQDSHSIEHFGIV